MIERLINSASYRFKDWKYKRLDYRSSNKVVLIESDDWGAIRVPGIEASAKLKSLGYALDLRPYERNDGLESLDDVKLLAQVLKSHRDNNGNSPIFTLNYLSCNPDFDAIQENGFSEYLSEPITCTYQKYGDGNGVVQFIKNNLSFDGGVFLPEYHGKEHFDIETWMDKLQIRDEDIMAAFDVGMCGIFPKNCPSHGNKYMVALRGRMSHVINRLREGLDVFKNNWGYEAESFTAPCYCWLPEIEEFLNSRGIRIIQGSRIQRAPFDKKIISWHYTGEQNRWGQYYTVRNCNFEPATIPTDCVNTCLGSIDDAFRHGNLAIISTHRINYTSRINKSNRNHNLELLDTLLSKILDRYPDVKFSTGRNIVFK